MPSGLDVWRGGRHIGSFAEADDGQVTFMYDADAPATPISLSLPRDGRATRRAAINFLWNLLPDEPRTRARLARTYDAAGTGAVDLLAAAGGDIAGGLVILPTGRTPHHGPPLLDPALPRDIAGRIASTKRDPADWAPADVSARFSLAGTQGKFALAEVDGEWYWSNESVPSTHIIKPGRPDLPDVEPAEVAALAVARAAGIDTCDAWVLHAVDQRAFVTARFDRSLSEGHLFAERRHTEDLAQAMGLGPAAKYGPSAKQVVTLLAAADDADSLVPGFLRQLVFNTVIGNADAHAKNYSLLLDADPVRMAPLYDAVPTGLYPQFDQTLAMPIAGATRAGAVDMDHWRKLARTVSFDADEMTALVRDIAAGVAEYNDEAWSGFERTQALRVHDSIASNADRLLGGPGTV